MSTLAAILTWAVFGLVIGAVARLLLPGRQYMGLIATSALGVVGSLAGGFIGYLFEGGRPLQPSGWILSILGALIVLGLGEALTKRTRTWRRI